MVSICSDKNMEKEYKKMANKFTKGSFIKEKDSEMEN